MYVQVLPQERWARIHLRLRGRKLTSLQACNTGTPLRYDLRLWESAGSARSTGRGLVTRKVSTFSTVLTWTFKPQQTFRPSFASADGVEKWIKWQVILQGMGHTCQCNTGCSKYLSSGVKGPSSMAAATQFYSTASVLLMMVLHSQAKFGSDIICSCSMSRNASIWLTAWLANSITEFSLPPSWPWHPRTAAPCNCYLASFHHSGSSLGVWKVSYLLRVVKNKTAEQMILLSESEQTLTCCMILNHCF